QITEHPVYPMSGSNLENDNALINSQMVFGFIKGYQSNPIHIKFNYPKDWKVGTPLEVSNETYSAQTYDELVDSPFMFGSLSHAASNIGGTNIHIYCYSQNGMITADSLKAGMMNMLSAAEKFIGKLPVKHYTFLFHFRKDLPPAYGAWEHSYSSFYAMPETPFHESAEQILSFASHEFFHIITPLNIHSEIVERFNFEKPVPSQHLWLYEGTTEWAAQMMQIRGGLISPDEFTRRISQKLSISDVFRQDISLIDLSLGSYDKLTSQYTNIYMKGAMTAMMLDMRLLELSHGRTGLREVIQKLSKKYGPKKAFSEKDFFDEFVQMTYPEIADFINRYIKGVENLPLKKTLSLAGYDYTADYKTGRFTSSRGDFKFDFVNNALIIRDVNPADSVNMQLGIKNGDALMKIKYKEETLSLFDPQTQRLIGSIQPRDTFTWIVKRDGAEIELTAQAGQKEVTVKHRIASMTAPTKEQVEFRKWWLSNR
ncbi:peptidase, partial [bacterium]|nr:peptidase [bacterium]